MEAPKPVADRYRFLKALRGSSKTLIWLATDEESDRTVVASLLPKARAAGVKPLTKVAHQHLARVHDVITDFDRDCLPSTEARSDGAIVIAEYVPGRTLHQRLESGALDPVKAVQIVMRLAKALRAIHDKGGIHGAVSPRSVVVTRAELGIVPVLSQLLAAPNGAYCSPERVTGGGPSMEDDAWALHSTLYAALTGRPPFSGESRKELARMILAGRPVPLSAFGVNDPALQELISRGVASKPSDRISTVKELDDELAAWSRPAASESVTPSSEPPPSVQVEPTPEDTSKELDTAPPPPAVDDEGITEAVLSPTSPNANLKTSVYAMPVQGGKKRRNDPAPEVEVSRPSMHDQEDILVALASQPSAAAGGEHEPRLVEDAERAAASSESPEKSPASSSSKEDASSRKKTKGKKKKPAEPDPGKSKQRPHDAKSRNQKADAKPAMATLSAAGSEPPSRLPLYAGVALVLLVVAVVWISSRGDKSDVAAEASATPTASAPESLSVTASETPPPPSAAARPAETATELAGPTAPKSTPAKPDAATASTATAPAPEAPAPAETASPTSAPTPVAAPEDVGQCVAEYYPPATFKNTEGFEFVCELTDPRKVSAKVHSKIVLGGLGKLTEGMRIWSQLIWYELASVAVARAGCCPGAAPLELPDMPDVCPNLAETLTALGKARTERTDVSIELMAFHDNVSCFYEQNLRRPYRYKIRPHGSNRLMFEGLIENAPIRN